MDLYSIIWSNNIILSIYSKIIRIASNNECNKTSDLLTDALENVIESIINEYMEDGSINKKWLCINYKKYVLYKIRTLKHIVSVKIMENSDCYDFTSEITKYTRILNVINNIENY